MKYSVAMKDRQGERHNLVIEAPSLNNALMQAHKKYRGGEAVAANPWNPPGQGRHNRGSTHEWGAANGGNGNDTGHGIQEVGSPRVEVLPPDNMVSALGDRIVMSVPWNCDVYVRRIDEDDERRNY